MSKQDEFSEQVILEHQSHPEYSLLETLEQMRATHGYESSNIKKYLTPTLIAMVQKEAQENSLIIKAGTNELKEWF